MLQVKYPECTSGGRVFLDGIGEELDKAAVTGTCRAEDTNAIHNQRRRVVVD